MNSIISLEMRVNGVLVLHNELVGLSSNLHFGFTQLIYRIYSIMFMIVVSFSLPAVVLTYIGSYFGNTDTHNVRC